jgi:O-antigen/teichoic acid export membrane protein
MSAADLVLTPPVGRVEHISAPSLRVSFTWTLAGNVVYAASQFGILSSLAKLGNSAMVGQYALGLAITAPVFMFTNLQLRGVQATDARHEYQFSDYFTLRCLSTLVGILAICVIVSLSHYDHTTKLVLLLVTSAKAFESFSDVIAGHLQKIERLDQAARALMIRGITSVVMFAVLFWLTRSLVIATLAQTVAWLTTILLYDFRVTTRLLGPVRLFVRCSPATLKSLVKVSWPLGLVMMLNSLNTNVPRYILENRLGVAELGIFASLAYMLTAMNLIILALGQSVSARLARFFAEGDTRQFKLLMHKLIVFSVCFGISGVFLAVVAGRQILTFVYRAQYASHQDLLIVMVIDAAIMAIGSFLGFGMTAARRFRPQMPITAMTMIVSAALTLALIPKFGLLGAGYALMIASLVRVAAGNFVLTSALNRAA